MSDVARPEIDFAALRRQMEDLERRLGEDSVDESKRREILVSRAARIADARHQEKTEELSVLAFYVGGEHYAVRMEEADQVMDIRGLFPLPSAARGVLGVVLARSRVVPVLDPRILLGLEGGGVSDLTKVVVVQREGEPLGLAVEAVDGQLEIPRMRLSPAANGPFLFVATGRLAILDLAKLGAEKRSS